MANLSQQQSNAIAQVSEPDLNACVKLCQTCAAGCALCLRIMKRATLYPGFLALALQAPAAFAQEKLEGKVVRTKTTHCDMNVKSGGCAGTLTLERKADGKAEELTFNVPLGTPISRAGETAYLPALRGKTVTVTHVTEKNERVAKRIEVAK